MKEYEVIIDYESLHLSVKAKNQKEANEKGYKIAQELHKEDKNPPGFWVAL